MWIFTKIGFFSAVASKSEKDVVVVRARDKRHLIRLKDFIASPELEVLETFGTDYPCRIVMPKSLWVATVRRLAEAIDYTNFKDVIFFSERQTKYEEALHKVWSVMRSITPSLPLKKIEKLRHVAQ